jgi:hypothetical protein
MIFSACFSDFFGFPSRLPVRFLPIFHGFSAAFEMLLRQRALSFAVTIRLGGAYWPLSVERWPDAQAGEHLPDRATTPLVRVNEGGQFPALVAVARFRRQTPGVFPWVSRGSLDRPRRSRRARAAARLPCTLGACALRGCIDGSFCLGRSVPSPVQAGYCTICRASGD